MIEKFSKKAINIYNSIDSIMSSLDEYTATLPMNEADTFIDSVYESVNKMLDKALIHNVINSREFYAICYKFDLCPDMLDSMVYEF